MKTLITNNLRGNRILILFILSLMVYLFMLTVTIPEVMSYSGGLKILDMIPSGYNSGYVSMLLDTLGVKGRQAYLYHQIPADMIYPFLFGVSNCLILAWLLNRLGKFHGLWFDLCLLPLIAGLFDYFENFGIISILTSYPHNPDILSQITCLFSVLKSSFTTLHFIVLIIVIILFGISRLTYKKRQDKN